MSEQLTEITYKTANGKQTCVKVSYPVKCLLEQTDRQIRSQGRQDRRHLDFVGSVAELDTLPTQPQEDIADLVIMMDDSKWLYSAIDELPELQRRRLCLYFFEGLTYRQIAELEGIDYRAIAHSVKRALKALREMYGK